MGYQYIENLKNARELLIREYEDTDVTQLPDERYTILLKYYDEAQLVEERKGYDVQMKSFEVEIEHLWDVLEMVYQDTKFMKRITDFSDLARVYRSKIRRRIKASTGDPLYEDIEKSWDEITYVKAADTQVEDLNRTYLYEKTKAKTKIVLMKDRLQEMYGFRHPIQRRVMEERLEFLKSNYNEYDYKINPYHLQPGLVLDVDITSIKRKKATLDGMANVLNEFLHGVSKGFQDAAFASFSRRRSTMRDDIAMSFSSDIEEEAGERTGASGQSYIDMLNEQSADATEPQTVVAEEEAPAPKRQGRPAGSSTKKAGGKKRGRPKKDDSGLKTL